MQRKSLREPSSVFTPKGERITEMYIPRVGLEAKLLSAMDQPKHVVVHGESGCGKSWLYKRVFLMNGVSFCTVNLARATQAGGGIAAVLRSVVATLSDSALVAYQEEKSASANAYFAEGSLSNQKHYSVRAPDDFLLLLSEMRKKYGSRRAALVFENLEHIISSKELLDEFKGLLLLVDDSEFAKHDIRTILVTTASDLRDYLAAIDRANTITNRLYEIPEVGRLVQAQAEQFVKKGLFSLLGINPSGVQEGGRSEDWVVRWILWFSDRIPQYLHELCLEVAKVSELSGRTLTKEALKVATSEWIRSSIIGQLTAVTSNLSAATARKSRKNQLIYALGLIQDADFDCVQVEKVVRSEFVDARAVGKLNLPKLLSELSVSQIPLIRRVPHSSKFRFIDPRYRILIRWVLEKDSSEALSVNDFEKGMFL